MSAFGKHPRCDRAECDGGVIRSARFGLRDCPTCEALRRQDMVGKRDEHGRVEPPCETWLVPSPRKGM